MSEVLTRKQIAERLQSHVGTFAEAQNFTDMFFDTLLESVAESDKFKIHNFGVFHCAKKKKRMGRNPKNQEAAVISARRVVRFTASAGLKQRVGGYGGK